MGASPARIEANRANARKSTGPRTAEGKAVSRGNAVKHGMTARVASVAGEDAEAMRREADAWVDELSAGSVVAEKFAEEAFQALVQLRRARRQSDSRLRLRIANAKRVLEIARARELHEAIVELHESPILGLARLMSTLSGCRWLKDSWEVLAYRVDIHDWNDDMHNRAQRLLGLERISHPFLLEVRRRFEEYREVDKRLGRQCALGWDEAEIRATIRAGEDLKTILEVKRAAEEGERRLVAFCREHAQKVAEHIPALEELARMEDDEAENLAFLDDSNAAQLQSRYGTTASRELHRCHKSAVIAAINHRSGFETEFAPADPEIETVAEIETSAETLSIDETPAPTASASELRNEPNAARSELRNEPNAARPVASVTPFETPLAWEDRAFARLLSSAEGLKVDSRDGSS